MQVKNILNIFVYIFYQRIIYFICSWIGQYVNNLYLFVFGIMTYIWITNYSNYKNICCYTSKLNLLLDQSHSNFYNCKIFF